jgi:hypothetical protein
MIRRLLLSSLLLGLVALFALPRACSDVKKQALVVEGNRVTVTNTTEAAWTDVEIWLNDHYRGQVRELAPGQRLDIPIRRFVAGRGQNFDPENQAPHGLELTAQGGDGKRVLLTWGEGRRR